MSDQNSLEIVPPVAFTAGETKEWAFTGSYFELIDCPDPVDVDLTDRNGSVRTRMRGAEASFYSKSVEFGRIVITSATAQTIKFAYGSGEAGTRRSTGAVTISGPVALDSTTLAALEKISEIPEVPSGSYSVAAALAVNTPVQVFSAASNPNGAVIYAAGCTTDSTSGDPAVTLLSKATAPGTAHDGFVYLRNEGKSQGTSWQSYSATLPSRVVVPPGHALYWIATQATGAASSRYCTYKLL